MHLITLDRLHVEGLNILYAEGKILGLSGRRTNNNNFLSFEIVRSAIKVG